MKELKHQCLRPCSGLYFDVKKSPAEVVKLAENNILFNDYQNYTSFQDDYSWFFSNNNEALEIMRGMVFLYYIHHYKFPIDNSLYI